MIRLTKHKDFQRVQNLPFCYWCGEPLARAERTRDHIPPRAAFAIEDRDPCLWLPSHEKCNGGHSEVDQLFAQLIGLKWGRQQSSEDRVMQIAMVDADKAAITNLSIPGVIWRWVHAFHAALYREWMPRGPATKYALETPFPHAEKTGLPNIAPILSVHRNFVHEIKTQRALGNLDRIATNNGKVIYECVWCRFPDADVWACVFALNIHDWKDLGRTPGQPARGCAGSYILPSQRSPIGATLARHTSIIIPNVDKHDPFAA
jgi:hypothetical protein